MNVKKSARNETMEEGFYAAPYDKDEAPTAENIDKQDEAGNAVYDMFCQLPSEEQSRVFEMIEKKHMGDQKKPMRPGDEREFHPMEKE